jgi:hypothetical protein
MKETRTPEEIVGLLQKYRPLVKRQAKAAWEEAGRPPGIKPGDLFNYGFFAVLGVTNERFMKSRVRSRIKDGLRALQVGAVTANPVLWPEGATKKARHVYSTSADGSALDDPFSFGVKNREDITDGGSAKSGTIPSGKTLKILQRRLQESDRGREERMAARVDLKDAIAQLPPGDHVAILKVFQLVTSAGRGDLAPYEAQHPGIGQEFENLWLGLRTPLAVTQILLKRAFPPEHVEACMLRTAAWVEEWCRAKEAGEPVDWMPLAEVHASNLEAEEWAGVH